jgi:hypothetical protein
MRYLSITSNMTFLNAGAATVDVVSVVGPNVTTTTYWGFSAGIMPATEVITWLPYPPPGLATCAVPVLAAMR